MYCPVMSSSDRMIQCKKTHCAWWDRMSSMCAMLMLATRFDAVTTANDALAIHVEEGEAYPYTEAFPPPPPPPPGGGGCGGP